MFRHCINKSKYTATDADTDHKAAAERHHSEIKLLASKSHVAGGDRTLPRPKLAAEPAAETGEDPAAEPAAAEPAAETGGEPAAEPAADPAVEPRASDEETRAAEPAGP